MWKSYQTQGSGSRRAPQDRRKEDQQDRRKEDQQDRKKEAQRSTIQKDLNIDEFGDMDSDDDDARGQERYSPVPFGFLRDDDVAKEGHNLFSPLKSRYSAQSSLLPRNQDDRCAPTKAKVELPWASLRSKPADQQLRSGATATRRHDDRSSDSQPSRVERSLPAHSTRRPLQFVSLKESSVDAVKRHSTNQIPLQRGVVSGRPAPITSTNHNASMEMPGTSLGQKLSQRAESHARGSLFPNNLLQNLGQLFTQQQAPSVAGNIGNTDTQLMQAHLLAASQLLGVSPYGIKPQVTSASALPAPNFRLETLSTQRDSLITPSTGLMAGIPSSTSQGCRGMPQFRHGVINTSVPPTVTISQTRKPVPDGSGSHRYPPPDTNSFTFDPATGLKFDHTTGLHYEANSGYYLNSNLKRFLRWDAFTQTYLQVENTTGLKIPQAFLSNSSNISSSLPVNPLPKTDFTPSQVVPDSQTPGFIDPGLHSQTAGSFPGNFQQPRESGLSNLCPSQGLLFSGSSSLNTVSQPSQRPLMPSRVSFSSVPQHSPRPLFSSQSSLNYVPQPSPQPLFPSQSSLNSVPQSSPRHLFPSQTSLNHVPEPPPRPLFCSQSSLNRAPQPSGLGRVPGSSQGILTVTQPTYVRQLTQVPILSANDLGMVTVASQNSSVKRDHSDMVDVREVLQRKKELFNVNILGMKDILEQRSKEAEEEKVEQNEAGVNGNLIDNGKRLEPRRGEGSINMSKSKAEHRSPARRLSRSPCKRLSRSPARRRNQSPTRRRSRSPVRRDNRSPIKRPSNSPATRNESPLRWKNKSPVRRRRSGSPPRRRSRSPVRRQGRSPVNRRGRSPINRQGRSPVKRGGRSPVSRGGRSPVNRGGRSPVNKGGRSPLNRQGRSPVNRHGRSPVDRQGRSPVNRGGRSPVNRQGRSPINKQGRSPVNRHGRSPVDRQGRSPVNRQGRSPVNRRGRSPVGRQGRSPIKRGGRSPINKGGRSPINKGGRSPINKRGRSPVSRQGRSPVNSQGRSPVNRRGRSPVNSQGRSPVNRRGRSPVSRKGRSPVGRQSSPHNRSSRTNEKRAEQHSLAEEEVGHSRRVGVSPGKSTRNTHPISEGRRCVSPCRRTQQNPSHLKEREDSHGKPTCKREEKESSKLEKDPVALRNKILNNRRRIQRIKVEVEPKEGLIERSPSQAVAAGDVISSEERSGRENSRLVSERKFVPSSQKSSVHEKKIVSRMDRSHERRRDCSPERRKDHSSERRNGDGKKNEIEPPSKNVPHSKANKKDENERLELSTKVSDVDTSESTLLKMVVVDEYRDGSENEDIDGIPIGNIDGIPIEIDVLDCLSMPVGDVAELGSNPVDDNKEKVEDKETPTDDVIQKLDSDPVGGVGHLGPKSTDRSKDQVEERIKVDEKRLRLGQSHNYPISRGEVDTSESEKKKISEVAELSPQSQDGSTRHIESQNIVLDVNVQTSHVAEKMQAYQQESKKTVDQIRGSELLVSEEDWKYDEPNNEELDYDETVSFGSQSHKDEEDDEWTVVDEIKGVADATVEHVEISISDGLTRENTLKKVCSQTGKTGSSEEASLDAQQSDPKLDEVQVQEKDLSALGSGPAQEKNERPAAGELESVNMECLPDETSPKANKTDSHKHSPPNDPNTVAESVETQKTTAMAEDQISHDAMINDGCNSIQEPDGSTTVADPVSEELRREKCFPKETVEEIERRLFMCSQQSTREETVLSKEEGTPVAIPSTSKNSGVFSRLGTQINVPDAEGNNSKQLPTDEIFRGEPRFASLFKQTPPGRVVVLAPIHKPGSDEEVYLAPIHKPYSDRESLPKLKAALTKAFQNSNCQTRLRSKKGSGAPYDYAFLLFKTAEMAQQWYAKNEDKVTKVAKIVLHHEIEKGVFNTRPSFGYFSKEDWTCQSCRLTNFPLRSLCHKCGKHKDGKFSPVSISKKPTRWVGIFKLPFDTTTDHILSKFPSDGQYIYQCISMVIDPAMDSCCGICIIQMTNVRAAKLLLNSLPPCFRVVHHVLMNKGPDGSQGESRSLVRPVTQLKHLSISERSSSPHQGASPDRRLSPGRHDSPGQPLLKKRRLSPTGQQRRGRRRTPPVRKQSREGRLSSNQLFPRSRSPVRQQKSIQQISSGPAQRRQPPGQTQRPHQESKSYDHSSKDLYRRSHSPEWSAYNGDSFDKDPDNFGEAHNAQYRAHDVYEHNAMEDSLHQDCEPSRFEKSPDRRPYDLGNEVRPRKPDGDQLYSYPPPDPSKFLYERRSKMEYDPETTLYFDQKLGFFYNDDLKIYLYYNNNTGKFIEVLP